MGKKKTSSRRKKAESNGANLGFEAKMWLAADKLRRNMDAAEYKHVVLGLIFLQYISDAFEEMHQKLIVGEGDYEGAFEDKMKRLKDELASQFHESAKLEATIKANLGGLGYGL